jgi:hypothetical protein
MAICPQYVSALRRAGRVKQRGLGGENERLVGMKATGYGIFIGRDFLEGTAKVNRDGATAGSGPPRYGLGESIVDLEGAGSVFKGPNCLSVARGEPVTGESEQGTGRGVTQGEGVATNGLRVDAAGSVDKSAEGLEMTNECARNGSGSASGNGPSD